jgi:hypothetical protein
MRLVLTLLLVVPLCAQEAAPKQARPAPKNLKVLQAENLMPVMRMSTAGLGVQCNFCHVADRSSDELATKVTARMMIGMMNDINAKFPDGKQHVTCYTCHRGAQQPVAAPPAP